MDDAVRNVLVNGLRKATTATVTVMVNDLTAALGLQADQFTKDAKPGSSITVNRLAVLNALEASSPTPQEQGTDSE